MPLADYALSIGGLTLGPGTDYIVHRVDGFGAPIDRISDTPRPRRHGELAGSDYLDGRTVTIEITVRGDTPAETVANLDALLAVWQPITDAGTVTALSYKFPGQAERQLYGRPRRLAADTDRIIGNRISATLEYRAGDPLQYAATATTGAIGLSGTAGGRTYSRTYPLTYGTSTSTSLYVTNAGTFSTAPTFRITGPATNPKVENRATGESLAFAIVLTAGQTLDVDTDARTVILDGTASRYSTLVTGSTFFDLNPGTTELRFVADVYNATATLAVSFRSAWI